MNDIKESNAIIESVSFDTERGLTMWVYLNYGGSGQGFGGYLLYVPEGWKTHANQANYCGHFVWRVLQIAGVDDIKKCSGKAVRVRYDRCKVHAIGHIIDDDWFDPEKEFEQIQLNTPIPAERKE